MRRLALLALCIASISSACGGSSTVDAAMDDARVASARLSMSASIAAQDGEELQNTAQYVERVRGVQWSDSQKHQEFEESASRLVNTCFDCYLLIKSELGG
jgi:hypothetical protein